MMMERDRLESMMGVCFACGHRWLIGDTGFDVWRELRDLLHTQWIYIVRGVIVWTIVSVPYVLGAFRDPIAVVTSSRGLVNTAVATVILGVILGLVLQSMLQLSGWLFPRQRIVHLVVPLLAAAFVGGIYPRVLETTWSATATVAVFRSELTAAVAGAALAILVTPIVIVRSSKARTRAGIGRPPVQSGDPRWRH